GSCCARRPPASPCGPVTRRPSRSCATRSAPSWEPKPMPEAGPGIVLVGMPGSGKSTVGRLVAERLGRPFIDTDERFEQLHGIPVPDYLRRHGEPDFRAAEAAAVT